MGVEYNAFSPLQLCETSNTKFLEMGARLQKDNSKFLRYLIKLGAVDSARLRRVSTDTNYSKWVIDYRKPTCEVDSTCVDLCANGQGNKFVDDKRNLSFERADFNEVCLGVRAFETKDFTEYCEFNGGQQGFWAGVLSQMNADLRNGANKLESDIIPIIQSMAGAYANDPTSLPCTRTLQMLLSDTNFTPPKRYLNPEWDMDIKVSHSDFFESIPDTFYIGGTPLNFLKQHTDPMVRQSVANAIYSQNVSLANKLYVINPDAVKLYTLSDYTNGFATVFHGVETLGNLLNLTKEEVRRGQALSYYKLIVFNPYTQCYWDMLLKIESCETYKVTYQLKLHYALKHFPVGDLYCGNDKYTGVECYTICEVPTLACTAPTPAACVKDISAIQASYPTTVNFTHGVNTVSGLIANDLALESFINGINPSYAAVVVGSTLTLQNVVDCNAVSVTVAVPSTTCSVDTAALVYPYTGGLSDTVNTITITAAADLAALVGQLTLGGLTGISVTGTVVTFNKAPQNWNCALVDFQ